VNAVLWFLSGALAGTLAAVVMLRRRRAVPEAVHAPVAGGDQRVAVGAARAPAAEPPPVTGFAAASATAAEAELDATDLAAAVAAELASLASGIEGRAHALVRACQDPAELPRAAEGMCASLRQLRRLHGKLVAYGTPLPQAAADPTDLASVVANVQDELRHADLGLTFAVRIPPDIPRVAAAREVLQDALLFTGLALRQLEQGALRMSVTAEPCIEEEREDTAPPCFCVEFHLEWDTDAGGRAQTAGAQHFLLRRAAERLLASFQGRVQFEHDPGHAACAVVALPAVALPAVEPPELGTPPPSAAPREQPAEAFQWAAQADDPAPRHRFGGVLVLESDPAVRAMLAVELKAAGRAIFACADSAAARSLLEATPERFELLIVDQDKRLRDAELAIAASEVCPDLKVCVLASPAHGEVAVPAGVVRIGKPFGPPELRSALAAVLAS
jgi:hypothetical protein